MYNSTIHHRRSIRLKEYYYLQAGMYFVTLGVQDRQCVFGEILNGEMVLNDAGKMIGKWYVELSNKFPDIIKDMYIIMLNHFHAIIINTGDNGGNCNGIIGLPQSGSSQRETVTLLSAVIQWFKTMITNEYIRMVKSLGWQPFNGKLWHRKYYEYIIRKEQTYQHIEEYIQNNPLKWDND